ncbi:MAG: PLP-dependent cysteine synthase family protein [Halolamina sp.]
MANRSATYDPSRIGRTPLVELDAGVEATVYAKVEWFNLPGAGHGGGSIKTRIAREMLDGAEARGELTSDTTIVEASSGNTGTGLARLACQRGYDVTVVMPEDAAAGKIAAIREAGGDVEFVAPDKEYDAMLRRSDSIVADDAETWQANQYGNPDNPGAHERTTGPEIWTQTDGEVTTFVAGVGTGGTVSGAGRELHTRGDVTVVGFEPVSAVHAIGGLKYLRSDDSYHPDTYDESVLDGKLYVETAAADDRARELRERYQSRQVPLVDTGQYDEATVREHLRVEGQFLVGPSSGAGVQAVNQLAAAGELDADETAVIMLCDRGDRYTEGLWDGYLDG